MNVNMQEEPGSPIASRGRKREPEIISPGGNGHLDPFNLASRKRIRHGEAGRDNSPVPVLFNVTEPVLVTSSQSHIKETEKDSTCAGQQEETISTEHSCNRDEAGAAPSINWNSGSKAKIRISLGRGPRRANSDESVLDQASIQAAAQNHRSNQPLQLEEPPLTLSGTLDSALENKESIVHGSETVVAKSENVIQSSISAFNSETKFVQAELVSRLNKNGSPFEGDSESDGGVVLNLQSSGQESGEITEANVQDSDTDRGSIIIITRSNSEDEDAMMRYSRSGQPAQAVDSTGAFGMDLNSREHQQRVLADLNADELNLQLRYFYPTTGIENLDRNKLVKCLVCAGEGHLADTCESLNCATCGKHNDHFTRQCAQAKRCRRCRELGHQSLDCPHKLVVTTSEITCDWCQRVGHVEDDCEILWRTSGRPWLSCLLAKAIQLGCYECGKTGHLGNDCSTRRPGKPMGTSTWSLSGNYESTTESPRGIMIKGRAQRQRPVEPDDSDNDKANFFRPKISRQLRKGQIRIADQNLRKNQPGLLTPINEPHQDEGKRGSQEEGYWDARRGREYSSIRDQGQYGYRPSDRRSVSPHYPFRGTYGKSSNYEPPLPHERPPRNREYGIEPYRPMSSAAQKAWSRHRS